MLIKIAQLASVLSRKAIDDPKYNGCGTNCKQIKRREIVNLLSSLLWKVTPDMKRWKDLRSFGAHGKNDVENKCS
jgi:hypothetical protein